MSAQPSSAITKASTALAAAPGPIGSVERLSAALEEMSKTANVLSPVAAVDQIMALHQVSLRVIKVDPTTDQFGNGPECYRDPRFCKPGEVALGKNALAKIMGAAGVQIASRRRLDDRSDPNYCEIEVVLAMRDFDGTLRQVIATKEMDMRPGAPETMKPEKDRGGQKTGKLVAYDDSALADKRRHIQSHAETKAIERAIRLLFSLRQKYSVEDLGKPFVVPKLVPALDPSDPEQKTALIQHALGSQAALYGLPAGSAPTRTLKVAGDDYDEPALDVSDMVEEPEPSEPAGDFPADPPAASPRASLLTGVKIEVVSEKRGPDGEDGKPKWTRYGVKVGEDWFSTFSDTMAATARAAKAQGATVTVEYAVDDKGYKNLTAITPGVQRDLPLTPPPTADADPWPADDPANLDTCPLPLSDQQIFSVPSNQENRVKALGMINTAFGQLVSARGEREARAIGAKVAGGLDPAATPMPELRAIWEALRAELGGGR